MRALLLLVLAVPLLALLPGPAALRADDLPAPAAPVVPGAAAEAPGGQAASPGWDADRLWFATLLRPAEAWAKLMADLKDVPPPERRGTQMRRAAGYVDAFEAVGGPAKPEEIATLVRFFLTAERYAKAGDSLLAIALAEDGDATAKDQAALQLATLLQLPPAREALGAEKLPAIVKAVQDYLAARSGEDGAQIRGQLHRALAADAGQSGDDAAAIRHQVLGAMEDPSLAAAAGRSVVQALQGSTHEMGGYEAVRAGAAASLPVLQLLAQRYLEQAKAEGNEALLRRAEAGVRLLEEAGKPLDMLGQPAPAWTVLKGYGEVDSLAGLKGKVVMIDFWATWCPWCIRSFPAIRDLLRDYADRGLAVVGVTAPATSVYEQRYDLDDDMKDAAAQAGQARPVARLKSGGPERDDGIPALEEAEYRAAEQEAIGRFVQNHKMTWPVVLIDQAEPSAKFALSGWPHAVVIDREGRIRYFKPGALLRDRPEQVAAFRKVLEDLLAEPVPAPAGN